MKKIISVGLFCSVLAGCATEPMSFAESKPVPDSRITNRNLVTPQNGTGSVLIKRDSGLSFGGCTFKIFVDGSSFADIDTGEKVQVNLMPGTHIFGAKTNGLCAPSNAEVQVIVTDRSSTSLRISVGAGGDMRIQPTAF